MQLSVVLLTAGLALCSCHRIAAFETVTPADGSAADLGDGVDRGTRIDQALDARVPDAAVDAVASDADASADRTAADGSEAGSAGDTSSPGDTGVDGDGPADVGPPGPPQPLLVADLEGMDLSGAPSLNVGFRCKAYAFCGVSQNCFYYSEALGHMNSSEAVYYDGQTLSPAQQVRFYISVGPASQCNDPPISIAAGEHVRITHDGGLQRKVLLPAFSGTSLTLYVATDGSTFYDAALTQTAQSAQ